MLEEAVACHRRAVAGRPGEGAVAAEARRLGIATPALDCLIGLVHDIESGRRVSIRGDQRFPMASTYKVPIAVELLRRVDALEQNMARQERVFRRLLDLMGSMMEAPK